MHILVTNDDGVTAPGLMVLAQEMRKLGEVTILAPDRNWSASGHVKTIHRPLRVKEVLLEDGSRALASDGAPSDCVALGMLGFIPEKIDLVVCNLYPFESTIKKKNVGIQEVIENIDIGGPTLIRAAAKNYKDVLVVTNPSQYNKILQLLHAGEDISLEHRERFALEAFAHTSRYDSIISKYLRKKWTDDNLPNTNTISIDKIRRLSLDVQRPAADVEHSCVAARFIAGPALEACPAA